MARLVEVDFNPFEEKPRMVAVDGNPFSTNTKLLPSHHPGLLPSHEVSPSLQLKENNGPSLNEVMKRSAYIMSPIYRPALEGGGALLGGIAGGLSGAPSGPGLIATTALGAGLGYGSGKGTADMLDMYAGLKKPYTRPSEAFKESAKDVATGAAFEIGGQTAPALLRGGAKLAGKAIKPALGRLSGLGTGSVDEALKSSAMFKKALRGKISGEEVVTNAKSALQELVDKRAVRYRDQLSVVSGNNKKIDLKPVREKLNQLMQKYNVAINQAGEIDTSRIAMGKKGRKDIEEIIETISSWGSRSGDDTAVGLDTLKRQLDDFYSESSQARQFVSSLKDKVKKTISESVPEYGNMLKEYSEATNIIKDIESGLMLRKKGMSGRIVADQTLRRLVSSMKDNFALRRELVEVLGNKAGADLTGQIAGYTMRSPIPVGLAGTGPMLAGEAALAYINPKFWPVLAASSPRVQAEFLSVFGKAMQTSIAKNKLMQKEIFKQTAISQRQEGEE